MFCLFFRVSCVSVYCIYFAFFAIVVVNTIACGEAIIKNTSDAIIIIISTELATTGMSFLNDYLCVSLSL